jgi:type I restriction enzyme S subunit
MKNNIPKLRFKEFSDEWQEKKLGDIGENIIGLTYSPKDVTLNEEYPIVLRSSNIQKGELDYKDIVRVKTRVTEKLFIKIGDILICTRNGSQRLIGKNTIIKKVDVPATFGAFMSVYRSHHNKFLSHLFETDSYNNQIQKNLGARINQLTTGYLNAFKFYIPGDQEQQKIAGFLTAVDEKVNKLEAKKKVFEEYKKGVMQAIFNQEIRFKKPDGSNYPDWEEKKIGEVLKIGSGRDYKHLEVGDIPVFGTGGYMLSVNKSLHSGETVFIGRKGTIDKPFYYKGDFWTVDTLFYTHNFTGIIPKFMSYVFERINWQKHNEASGVPSLSKTTIEKIKVNLPSLFEQERIAEFLTSLDSKVDLINKQSEQTKLFKKSLLQQMFI